MNAKKFRELIGKSCTEISSDDYYSADDNSGVFMADDFDDFSKFGTLYFKPITTGDSHK